MAASKGGGRKGKRYQEETPDVKLSKFLSFICRHGAEREGIEVHAGGFVSVSDILSTRQGSKYSEDDVKRVVANCPKSRFALQEDPKTGLLQIRANQGHTIQVEDLELSPVLCADDYPVVVHGTNKRSWELIKNEGLSKMSRNHIHFATGLPGDSGVISGMRSNSQVHIFVDLKKALEDGYEFFCSANSVILCSGNERGILPPKYFAKVIDHKSGSNLL